MGGRRAQHWRAKEHRQAEQERLGSESSSGSPEPRPKVTPLQGFKGVVACLLRGLPSPASVETSPKVSQSAMLAEAAVTMMYVTHIVQDEVSGVTYLDTVTVPVGRMALRNVHMVATLPGATVEELAKEEMAEGCP